MTSTEAAQVLEALANGIDPETGEVLAADSALNNTHVVRALFLGAKALAGQAAVERPKKALVEGLERVGSPWTKEEDARLARSFQAGKSAEALAAEHQRKLGGIRSRLLKLGLVMPVAEIAIDEPAPPRAAKVGMTSSPRLADIQALEVELHHPGVPCSAARLEQLLHADFHEVGRSGRKYDRATVIRFLSGLGSAPPVLSDDFVLAEMAPGAVLLTYRSAHRGEDGSLGNHTLRSSLWVQVGTQWQLRYHQGTPAAEVW